MNKRSLLACVGVTSLALLPATAAYAQAGSAGIGEVIVTATKTGATSLQKTPLSVAVVSDSALKASQATSLRDLPSLVSGLKFTTANIATTIYVRGVGGSQANEGDVSIYTDGVYVGANTAVLGFQFNDIDRIEVVKGPQGTLFGRNSNGGAINFVSKTPSNEFKFQNTLNVGNYNLVDDSFYVSGPLIKDRLQGSLAVNRMRHDGYIKNIVPGSPDLSDGNRWGARGQLRWQITDNLVNTLRVDGEIANENYASQATLLAPVKFNSVANAIVGNFHYAATNDFVYNREQTYGASNELNWTLNDNLSLKSITAYRTDKTHNASDADSTEDVTNFGGVTAWQNGTFSNLNLGAMDTWEHQISQEFNLLHKFGPIEGVVGTYYFDEYVHQIGSTIAIGPAKDAAAGPPTKVGSPRDTRVPVTSKAVFFQETYHITPRLGFNLGARYTEETKVLDTYNISWNLLTGVTTLKFDARGANAAVRKFHALSPKAGVNWQITDDALVYASATKGFKSGGFVSSARALGTGNEFGPETMWSYEIGTKTDWLDHRLRINLAAFRNDWKGLQFSATISTNPPISGTFNAAAATITGFEADITAKPTPSITLTGNATFLDSKYENFTGNVMSAVLASFLTPGDPRYNSVRGTYDASGQELVSAPKVSAVFAAQKDFELPGGDEVFVRGEYQYTSKTFFDPSNIALLSQPEFSLYNASLGYTLAGGHWQAVLWGKNLTDEQYILRKQVGGAAASPHITAPIGAPKTVGVRLNYTY
ncbi:MAG TPA: TonB-dependent receptor [Caulobacterales bacterium]|nr:TonB-dependent receptor [Caulobacterales bacterium]